MYKKREFLAGLVLMALAGCATNHPSIAPSAAQPASVGTPGASDPLAPLTQAERDSRRESRALLEGDRYAELDARMNGFQQAYRDNSLDDVGLVREFAAFMVADPALEAKFAAWIQSYPRSYAARLSRGIYYVKCGTQTRGTKYMSHTTREQVQGMTHYLDKAQRDLEDSLALEPKPTASYRYLIKVGMEYGTKKKNRELLSAALQLDPISIMIRRTYMMTLETRWGGSLGEMTSFLEESRKAGVPADQLQSLGAMIDKERQWLNRNQPDGASSDTSD
jgi:Domain of unknown function (DUF4034)